MTDPGNFQKDAELGVLGGQKFPNGVWDKSRVGMLN